MTYHTDQLGNSEISYVKDTESAYQFVQWANRVANTQPREPLAIDTETEGLLEYNWRRQYNTRLTFVRLLCVATIEQTWAVPTRHFLHTAQEGLKVLLDTGRPIVFHNAMFDIPALRISGIVDLTGYRTIHDTMLMHACWEPGPHGLEDITKKLWPRYNPKEVLRSQLKGDDKRINWATIDVYSPELLAYGAVDALTTAHVYYYLDAHLRSQDLYPGYDREIAYLRVMEQAMMRGFQVDSDLAIKHAEHYRHTADAIVKDLDFNPNSSDQVAQAIPDLPQSYTKTGKVKTDREALLQSKTVEASQVLEVRRLRKYASAYFDRLGNPDPEGRIHPDFRVMGAATGRSSIANPALQQLPKNTTDVRECVIPSSGSYLTSIDYKQQEARLFAHYSGSEQHLHAIRNDLDLHTMVSEMVGINRTHAKTLNFAMLYGAGVSKISQNMGVSETEGQEILAKYHAAFPQVKPYMDSLTQRLKVLAHSERPYVETWGGRRNFIEYDSDSDDYKWYTGVNYLCQGTGADVLKEATLRLDEEDLSQYILVPVHDELLFDFPAADAEELAHEAGELMQDMESFRVPLPTDVSPPLDRWRKT